MKKKTSLTKTFICLAEYEDSALAALERELSEGGRVGVACSGGADSVFLLLSILSIFKDFAKRIVVLHFNHKVRPNADLDEDFVRSLCEKLNVEVLFGSPQTPAVKHSEGEFRKMRMDFFDRAVAEKNLCAIAQGHHADDLCETLLMRFMRGAGTEGLCAPRPVSKRKNFFFARPLLRLKKTEIVEFLREAKLDWREDESNASDDFLRNRVRKNLLPLFIKEAPTDFYLSAARVRNLLQADADFIDEIFRKEISEANGKDFFELGTPSKILSQGLFVTSAMSSSAALIRRAVYLILSAASLAENVRAKGVDAFLDEILCGKKDMSRMSVGEKFLCFYPNGNLLKIESSSSFSSDSAYDQPLKIGKNILPTGDILFVKKITINPARRAEIIGGKNDDSRTAYLDTSAAGTFEDFALCARTRKPRDAYQPLGAKSERELVDLFSAKKIPLSQRSKIPIVYNKRNEILWAVHLPPSKRFALANSSVAIELTFEAKVD